MARPLVSVVIPCFRQGHFLAAAIDSALAQTYPNVEVIVVNDGSDDDTEAVALRYGDRIRYLHQTNRGLCSARNRGIEASAGKYLHFLDADDLIAPESIERLVETVDGREDRLGLMGMRFFSTDPYGKGQPEHAPTVAATYFAETFDLDPLLRRKPANLKPPVLPALPYLIYTNFGPPHCWICPREMVVDVDGFDLGLSGCADWDLWLRLALAGAELELTPYIGALYRRYDGSMSTKLLPMLEDRVRVFLSAARNVRSRPELVRDWGVDMLQAGRRIRRRCAVHGLRSPVVREVANEIARLQRLVDPTVRGRIRGVREFLFGQAEDRLCLARYALLDKALSAYYVNDYD